MEQLTPGSAPYSRVLLAIYDPVVLGLFNRFVWRCPSDQFVGLYNRSVSARHMDIGVGTGFFLDRCRFPVERPVIALVDLNSNSLEVTARRIRRYRPASYLANVLEPMQIDLAPFDSIGLNYLLHCLPGNMAAKAAVFRNIKPLLSSRGVVFGSTILARGVPHRAIGRAVMRTYNARGVFGNQDDTMEGLEAALQESFSTVQITLRGTVALFTARP